MQSLFLSFVEEFRAHAGRACPSPRGLVLPKIVDWNEAAGRFQYEEGYARKRPDWTYWDAWGASLERISNDDPFETSVVPVVRPDGSDPVLPHERDDVGVRDEVPSGPGFL